jgi:serine/threonine protein kinase
MDVQGRTRVSDFGLAGHVPAEGLTKCCGTRGYWAPEMVARPRVPYFLAADWFSLGVSACMFVFSRTGAFCLCEPVCGVACHATALFFAAAVVCYTLLCCFRCACSSC